MGGCALTGPRGRCGASTPWRLGAVRSAGMAGGLSPLGVGLTAQHCVCVCVCGSEHSMATARWLQVGRANLNFF